MPREAGAVRPPPLALAALAVAGCAFALGLADAGLTDTFYGSLRLFVGASFIGVGLYAWCRRPNRIGPLMVVTGFLWFLANVGDYVSDPAVFTSASVVGMLYHATTIHLLLAFPSGRLETRAARLVAVSAYTAIFGGGLLVYVVADPRTDFGCATCPDNILQVAHSEQLADVVIAAVNLVAAAIVAVVLAQLIATWRRSEGWRRQALTPLLFSGLASAFLLGLTFLVLAFDKQVADDVFIAATTAFAAVPYAFLVGLARVAMLGGGAVSELVGRLTEASGCDDARAALRQALGDPSLDLGFWQPRSKTYTNPEGRTIDLPGPGAVRRGAPVEIEGEPVAVIVYDSGVVDDPQLVEAAAAASALAIEKHRLDAELHARLEELRASRERIVEAGYDERRRLERNLHDGAQQRLVSLALELRLAHAKLASDPRGAEQLLAEAGRELELALGELRELARGIHPAILSDRGLAVALHSLAARTPFRVSVDASLDRRLPENLESAAYFVVSEGLANATKHAHANHASVRVTRDNGAVLVEVADDGVGGADPAHGSGLRGLLDRVSALDGRFEVDSRLGGGTTLRARIPCG
jgi:signal transduction histidine kinase